MAWLNKTLQEWVSASAWVKHHRFDEIHYLPKGTSQSRIPQAHNKFLREITLDRLRGDTELDLLCSICPPVRSPQFFTPSPVTHLNLLCLSPLDPCFPACQYKVRKKSSELYPKSLLSNRNWDIARRVAKFKKLLTQLARHVSDNIFPYFKSMKLCGCEQNQTLFSFLTLAKWRRHPRRGGRDGTTQQNLQPKKLNFGSYNRDL